jgi:monoamine oxidase
MPVINTFTDHPLCMKPIKTGFITLAFVSVLLFFIVLYQYTSSPLHARKGSRMSQTYQQHNVAGGGGKWIVVGTGISACGVLHYLPSAISSSVIMYEAGTRVGGRILSAPKSLTPPNTDRQVLEFGAWSYDVFEHVRVKSLLKSLNIPTKLQKFSPAQSFVYIKGERMTWPNLPNVPVEDMPYGETNPDMYISWYAHTGIMPSAMPSASAHAVSKLIIAASAAVVTGLGWLSAPFQCIGTVPVLYNEKVNSVHADATKGTISLKYTSGSAISNAKGVVLTGNPNDVLAIQGVLPSVKIMLQNSFDSYTQGVLYAQWTSDTTWWPQLGFTHGVAATDTNLGRIFTTDVTTLRCVISGQDNVEFWTNAFVTNSMDAVAEIMANQLREVFGSSTIPKPAYVSFRGWPNGLWLWKAGVNKQEVGKTLSRPCGNTAPVWWVSGDISTNQGWVEGCLQSAEEACLSIANHTF